LTLKVALLVVLSLTAVSGLTIRSIARTQRDQRLEAVRSEVERLLGTVGLSAGINLADPAGVRSAQAMMDRIKEEFGDRLRYVMVLDNASTIVADNRPKGWKGRVFSRHNAEKWRLCRDHFLPEVLFEERTDYPEGEKPVRVLEGVLPIVAGSPGAGVRYRGLSNLYARLSETNVKEKIEERLRSELVVMARLEEDRGQYAVRTLKSEGRARLKSGILTREDIDFLAARLGTVRSGGFLPDSPQGRRTVDLLVRPYRAQFARMLSATVAAVEKKKGPYGESNVRFLRRVSERIESSRAARDKDPRVRPYFPRGKELDEIFRLLLLPHREGTLRIGLSLARIDRDIRRDVLANVDVALCIILRALFVSIFFSYLLARPVRWLAEGAEAVGAGNYDHRIAVRTWDELGALADRFNTMAANIKRHRAELVDKSRMEEELSAAQEIQKALLPESPPERKGWSFATFYRSATESGGDYFDFVEIDSRRLGLVIADVSGHGVGGGIVMTMTRSAFRSEAEGSTDPAEVLRRVNPTVFRDTISRMFVTMFYAILTPSTGDVRYASAGHNPAFLYRGEQKDVRELKEGGVPLGSVESDVFDGTIEAHTTKVDAGDALVLYTDGVTEAMSVEHEELGDERFVEIVRRSGGRTAQAILDSIVKGVEMHTRGAKQSDDITLVVAKRER
jgi:serine phosphatase RsbU (regulator of sigma subunit)